MLSIIKTTLPAQQRCSVVFLIVASAIATAGDNTENIWEVSKPLLFQGPEGSFDEVSVKDPSVVFYEGKWHVFYTARGQGEFTTGYVSAEKLTDLQHGKWKALCDYNGSRTELYDLSSDPGESKNLADTHPEIAKKLMNNVIHWNNSIQATP